MAITVKVVWFGLQFWVDEDTTQLIESTLDEGGGIAEAVSAAIAAGSGGTAVAAAVVSAIVGGILFLGSGALKICDSAHRGVIITVLWIAVPWCTGR